VLLVILWLPSSTTAEVGVVLMDKAPPFQAGPPAVLLTRPLFPDQVAVALSPSVHLLYTIIATPPPPVRSAVLPSTTSATLALLPPGRANNE
jgi:hypothetical protein